jgi:hypothetical protein
MAAVYRAGGAGSRFQPRTSPARGPLGNVTTASTPLAVTRAGTPTECVLSRPQVKPHRDSASVSLPGAAS